MVCGPVVFRALRAAVLALVFSIVMTTQVFAEGARLSQADPYDDRYDDGAPYETYGETDRYGETRDRRDERYGEPIEDDYAPDARAEPQYDDDDFDRRRVERDDGPQENQLLRDLTYFVQHDYLGNGRLNHISDAALFADRVDYYGRRRLSRRAVDASRHSYYRKWPQRRYEFIPDSMRIRQRGEDSVDIAFRYTFELAGRGKRIRGVGRTRLTVRQRHEDGAFEITRENGRVLRRY